MDGPKAICVECKTHRLSTRTFAHLCVHPHYRIDPVTGADRGAGVEGLCEKLNPIGDCRLFEPGGDE